MNNLSVGVYHRTIQTACKFPLDIIIWGSEWEVSFPNFKCHLLLVWGVIFSDCALAHPFRLSVSANGLHGIYFCHLVLRL